MRSTISVAVNRPSVIFDVQANETVIIDLATGHYFRLDSASTELWKTFDAGASVADILGSCSNASDLEPRLDGIVDDLIARGLLREAGAADRVSTDLAPWHFSHFTLEEFTDLEDILGLDPIHEVDPAKGWPHVKEG